MIVLKLFGLHDLYKIISALQGLKVHFCTQMSGTRYQYSHLKIVQLLRKCSFQIVIKAPQSIFTRKMF